MQRSDGVSDDTQSSRPPVLDTVEHVVGLSASGARLEGRIVAGGGLRLELQLDGVALPVVRLGLVLGDVRLADSELLGVEERDIADAWHAVSGKSTGMLSDRHVEYIVRLRAAAELDWELHVRLAPNGVAFRYAAEALRGHRSLTAECTTIELPHDGRAWVLDYQTWYETPRRGVDVAGLPAGEYGFPFLLRAGADARAPHVLLSESDIDGRFSGSHATVSRGGELTIVPADDLREVTRGPLTPWRVMIVGSLSDVVESRFVDELAPAPFREIALAVRPGRAAWSWWSDFYSGAQLERQKHFVDRAAEFGWEHLLIDCGWEQTWVPEIVAYASLRGIQVHLWAVWHDLDGTEKLSSLALWRSWGVAGIKVDFMESESKDRYRWYDTILLESARLGLMVNFHGSVIPRGWARTWPQVIGYEAVRGAEYYVFYDDTPLTASHNVIQPFTRNVVGSMDYTPVALTAPGRTTSDAHELALAVVFECGITNFADDVDVYASRPEAARALSELPPTWDETLLLAGSPDTEAVVARRHGDRWFLAAIASGPARDLVVPLERLGDGPWRGWIVTDGSAGGLASDEVDVEDVLRIPLVAEGGFFAILAQPRTELFRATPRAIDSAPVVEPTRVQLSSGRAELVTASDATLRVPPGWSATPTAAGRWEVRAPESLPPGQLGVVSVEESASDGPPRVTHARAVAPLTPGEHVLSLLPMLSFTNESGPVERDMSNGGGNPADGRPMRIAGAAYRDGFGVSTPSVLVLPVEVDGGTLRLDVGVDDETADTRAVAEVLADGSVLARVEVHSGAPATSLSLELPLLRTLELRTTPVEPGDIPAHVDWADARLTVSTTDLHINPSPDHR